MAASKNHSVRPWTPMIAFFGLIVGIVFLLWWMSRPPKPTDTTAPQPGAGMSAPALAESGMLPPGSPRPSRKLCGNDQVSAYIGKEVTEGELPEADLRELTKVVMSELEQAGAVKNGCVEAEIVKAIIYQMANEANQAPF